MNFELEPKTTPTRHDLKQNLSLRNSEPQQVGFAVVGLGRFCLANVLPAFEWCESARLSALVSAHADRATHLARQHDLPDGAIFTFQDFDLIKHHRETQAVYITLRGALRDQMILRAARAGKHIICEGRFSSDTKVDRKIADACDEAGVTLMMAYRRPGIVDALTVLKLDHLANCILSQRAPLRLSDVLSEKTKVPRIYVARWAN